MNKFKRQPSCVQIMEEVGNQGSPNSKQEEKKHWVNKWKGARDEDADCFGGMEWCIDPGSCCSQVNSKHLTFYTHWFFTSIQITNKSLLQRHSL